MTGLLLLEKPGSRERIALLSQVRRLLFDLENRGVVGCDASLAHFDLVGVFLRVYLVGSNYSAEPQHAIMAGFADEW